jgi:gamma-glutamyl hydrolase
MRPPSLLRAASALVAAAALGAAQPPVSPNPQPIIGILTMPNTEYDALHGAQFFPASYVKFLESGGARVVPIRYDAPAAATRDLLRQINGALFTGGAAAFFEADGVTLTQYAATASIVFNESEAAAAAGESWPLWGTCLGHQLISVLGAGADGSVLTGGFDAENLTLAVDWTGAAPASRLWGPAPDVRARLAGGRIAMNAHSFGVTPANFASNKRLSARFTVLATQTDRKGQVFTAAQEHQGGVPIFSTQWHPEKSMFEWPVPSTEFIAHNLSAVLAAHWPAASFVSFATSSRKFDSPAAEYNALIYNYSPVYGLSSMFEQFYFFPAS